MTYNVFGGTLNLAQSILLLQERLSKMYNEDVVKG